METVETQYAEAIPYFRGMYLFLSNFHEEPVAYDGVAYPSAENAYQAQKTSDQKVRQAFRDPALSPGMAKALGRSLKIRDDWDQIKDQIMLEIVRSKFSEMNQKLRTKLGHWNKILV